MGEAHISGYFKIFGNGPLGISLSVLCFILFYWIECYLDWASIYKQPDSPYFLLIPFLFLCAAIGFHIWAFKTLQIWFIYDQLCTQGPFKLCRHPIYASLISIFSLGLIIYLNSWIMVLWFIATHIMWGFLVQREEQIMLLEFGNEYKAYMLKTYRFWPKLC